jgi:hypothetical protein
MVLRVMAVVTIACAVLVAVSQTKESFVRAQSPQIAPAVKLRLPDESTGIDGIARTLVSAFDQVDIVALGEAHGRKLDSELRIAVVRHPDFANKVRSIVVEFGSTSEQSTLDRYIRGENVSRSQLEQVWKTTEGPASGVWESPIYAEFFAAVRDVNSRLPPDARIRVFGGDPGRGANRIRDTTAISLLRDTTAISLLKEQAIQKHAKALVVYGAAHFYRTDVSGDVGIVKALESEYPGRTLAVIPVGGSIDLPPGTKLRVYPDYQKFDRALMTKVRPVLVPLHRAPFRDFTVEEFVGYQLLTCLGPGGCRSVFQGSGVTLGQIADACVYVGAGDADVDPKAKSIR